MAECNYNKKYEEYLRKTFGELTILELYKGKRGVRARCQCECGNEHHVDFRYLKLGRSTHCGCIKRTPNKKHGLHDIKEYSVWKGMKRRCYNPNEKCFPYYGGRGITVCDEWKNSFEAFYKDMGERPENTSLDRINTDGDYEPGNCRWTTLTEQSRNKRNNRFFTFEGKTQCLMDWANELGISEASLRSRLKHYSVEKALAKQIKNKKEKK
jgi:hypothetical protein